ncbi:hypothetical protein [Pelistega ratti]|uniref:hypothetical protein n=1 Tax=Pelistega ratti TaxID=2652177 RepID=UPI001357DB25|nr:hypothetical protein [Pelistega ratti]
MMKNLLKVTSGAALALLLVACSQESDPVKDAKEKVSAVTQDAKEAVSNATESAKEAVSNATESAKEAVSNATEEVKEAVSNAADEAKEAVSSVTEGVKDKIAEVTGDPAADLKKLLEWGNEKQAEQQTLQQQAQAAFESQDESKIQEMIQKYSASIEEMKQSLASVDIKSDVIKPLKTKLEETLVSSEEVMKRSAETIRNRTEENIQLLQAAIDKTVKQANELQALQTELQEKFSVK